MWICSRLWYPKIPLYPVYYIYIYPFVCHRPSYLPEIGGYHIHPYHIPFFWTKPCLSHDLQHLLYWDTHCSSDCINPNAAALFWDRTAPLLTTTWYALSNVWWFPKIICQSQLRFSWSDPWHYFCEECSTPIR